MGAVAPTALKQTTGNGHHHSAFEGIQQDNIQALQLSSFWGWDYDRIDVYIYIYIIVQIMYVYIRMDPDGSDESALA